MKTNDVPIPILILVAISALIVWYYLASIIGMILILDDSYSTIIGS